MSRLVVQDVLDQLHDVGRQLGQDVQRLQVVDDLLGLGSTEDTGGDVFVLDDPGQGQVGHGAAERLFGQISQSLDLLDLGLAFGGFKLLDGFGEELLVGSISGVFGDTVVVLAGQHARVQGGPRSGSHLVLSEH